MSQFSRIRALLAQSWAPRDIAVELGIGVLPVYRVRSEMAAEEAQMPAAREEIRRRAALRIRQKSNARAVEVGNRRMALRDVAERSAAEPKTSDQDPPDDESNADPGVQRCGQCGLMEPHECFRFDARDRRSSDT